MRQRAPLLTAAWLLALLVLPGLLWVGGVRQPHVEGKGWTPVPADLTSRAALENPETYAELDQFVLDRLPLRDRALELRAWIAVDLFGSSPVPGVLVGSDGWFYLPSELMACDGTAKPSAELADVLEVTAGAIVATGRRAGVVGTGSKLIAESEHRPYVDPALLRCVRAIEDRAAARMRRVEGGLDLDTGLDAIRARGRHTFLKHDTHWNDEARLFVVRAVLDRIRPGLAAEAGIAFGPTVERATDLAGVMEIERTDRDRLVVHTSAVREPLERGSVLLIGDSQIGQAFVNPVATTGSLFDGPLRGQRWCDLRSLDGGYCDDGPQKAETVIVQASARHASLLAAACGRLIAPLATELRGRRAAFRADGAAVTPDRAAQRAGGPLPTLRVVEPTAFGRLNGGGARLIRLPVVTRGPDPITVVATAGRRTMPCVAPGPVVSRAIHVPVPGGVAIDQVAISVRSPAGTVLGRPEVVDLTRAAGARAVRRRR